MTFPLNLPTGFKSIQNSDISKQERRMVLRKKENATINKDNSTVFIRLRYPVLSILRVLGRQENTADVQARRKRYCNTGRSCRIESHLDCSCISNVNSIPDCFSGNTNVNVRSCLFDLLLNGIQFLLRSGLK